MSYREEHVNSFVVAGRTNGDAMLNIGVFYLRNDHKYGHTELIPIEFAESLRAAAAPIKDKDYVRVVGYISMNKAGPVLRAEHIEIIKFKGDK